MDEDTRIAKEVTWLQQRGREQAYLALCITVLGMLLWGFLPKQVHTVEIIPWLPDTSIAFLLLALLSFSILLLHCAKPLCITIATLLAGVVLAICLHAIYMQLSTGGATWSVVILGRSIEWPYQKIALNTFFDLSLLCVAILTAKWHIKKWVIPRIISVAVMLNVLFVFAMYINSINFFKTEWSISTTSVITLFCLLCLSLSMMTLQAQRGVLWVFASNTISGNIVRQATLSIITLPILLSCGFFIIKPFTNGSILEWMSALFVLNVILLILFVIFNAKNLAVEEVKGEKLKDDNEALQSRLQAVLDYSDAMIYTKNLQGKFTLVNRQLVEVFQKPEEFLLGKTTYDFLPKEYCDIYAQHDKEVLQVMHPVTYEEKALHPDGTTHIYLSSKFALRNKEGEVYGVGGIATDITELKRQENAIKLSEEKLKTINSELESFSYSVSHDLRAPLRAISGFGQALMEEGNAKLDKDCQEYLHRMMNAADKMSHLIDDLLRLSRISQQEINAITFNLSEVCNNIFQEKKAWGLNSKVMSEVEDNIFVTGDEPLIQVMMENLILNALKFSSKVEQPKVVVGTLPGDKKCIFISDNGVGFDEKYGSRLFHVFQRLHKDSEFPGTGIGLALVARIAEKHDITVWAESMPGIKTTFYIKFP